MWTFNQTRNTEKKVLGWQDFQPDFHEDLLKPQTGDISSIASYLRRLLENYEESEFIKYLIAPSPIALSGFFHCREADIYSALLELERQGYQAETNGGSAPIVLWDPLIRRKTIRREHSSLWQHVYQMLASPSTQNALS